MPQDLILYPFLAMMLLTMIVWIYMYSRRIYFILSNQLNVQDMTPSHLAKITPPAVSNPSDNLKNLFEVPIIFYAITLALYGSQQVDTLYLTTAWIFVALRILHSIVHCTFNLILLRFYLYFFASIMLWFMVLRVTISLIIEPTAFLTH